MRRGGKYETVMQGHAAARALGQWAVSAAVVGVTTAATFSFTAVAAAPANIAIVSGDAQTGRVNEPLTSVLVARVTDRRTARTAGCPAPLIRQGDVTD